MLPATNGFRGIDEAPRHPALECVAAAPQPISAKYARWLVVMRKVRPWAAADATAETRALVRMGADAPWAKLREKIGGGGAAAAAPPPPPAEGAGPAR